MINVVYSSDYHVNSDTALLAPNVKIDSGRTISLTPYQELLWRYYTDFCDRFAKLPGEKVVVLHGDLFDLDTLGGQRISDNPADILKMGKATFAPLLDCATYRIIVRGTDKHNGQVNYLEEAFASTVGTQRHPETGNYAWWEARQNVAGINVHVAHHTNVGQKPWTEINPIMSKIYEIMISETRQGYAVPDLIIRGHTHTPIDTEHINPFSRFIITPSWQGKNVYAYKKALDKPTFHGGTFVTFDHGKFEVNNIIYKPRKDAVWTL